jgi:4-amino-4-deoxy-L-arabinose transferase-like glycosyltransferase
MPEARGWLGPALIVVGIVTALRIFALAFNRTDLFVDEAQYWFWGQNLDFGYYSKPPLIAWVIRAFTAVLGDGRFAIRLPGALLHAATALVLAALAARLHSGRAALWVAASYITLPFVALGSLLISTDTILAPFFAAGLLFWFRAAREGRAPLAALSGVMIGLAALAKYAAIYFFPCAVLAAALAAPLRGTVRLWLALGLGFAVTILPNVVWNLTHDLSTVEHTMDNVGWVRSASGPSLDFGSLAEFFGSQFAVFGPVLFTALLWVAANPRPPLRRVLLAFSLPILLVVCVQALLDRAYANWAVVAYYAGILVAVPFLLERAPKLLAASLVINTMISVLLPALTVLAPWPQRDGQPLLQRYLGQAALSAQILDAASRSGAATVLARDRAILADLAYSGRDAGLAIRAVQPEGRPGNYFEQSFAIGPADQGPVLAVLPAPPVCEGGEQFPLSQFDTRIGAWHKTRLAGYVITAECARALR